MENDNDLEILESKYIAEKNPIYIILAFVTAHYTKRPQPQWVNDQIAKVFIEYTSKVFTNKIEKSSLDKLFRLETGRGRSSRAVDRFWLHHRDEDLMEGIFRLRTFFKKKMPINDASKIIYAYHIEPKNRHSAWPFIPSPGKLDRTYRAEKWKNRFQDRHYKPGSNYRFAAKLLKYAPLEVRGKYQPIMNRLEKQLTKID